MGGPNLEIFKFGMYIMFPIGWMYYFGTNLDDKFSVKDFWPTKAQLNKVPTEREDIQDELERMKRRRLRRKELRLEGEEAEAEAQAMQGIRPAEGTRAPVRRTLAATNDGSGGSLDQMGENIAKAFESGEQGWMSWIRGR